jgi:hypothetical protein
MNMGQGSAEFHEELKALGTLHDKKQQDYGTDGDPFANVRAAEDFGVPAWLGCLIRMNDKMTRLKNFAKKRELANESVEDSLRDLAVYSLIALLLYREEKPTEEKVDLEAGVCEGFD